MFTIYHFLSWLAFSVGLLIGYLLLSKLYVNNKYKSMMLLMFICGLSFGGYQHVFMQDNWDYDKEVYQSLVVEGNDHYRCHPNFAICLALYNDYSICPPKDDPRWDNPFYFGEHKNQKIYIGTGLINPVCNVTETGELQRCE